MELMLSGKPVRAEKRCVWDSSIAGSEGELRGAARERLLAGTRAAPGAVAGARCWQRRCGRW